MLKKRRTSKPDPLRKQLEEALARSCELREMIRSDLDESRETLVAERQMWEVLVGQSDVLEVTGCANMQEVIAQRACRTAMAEENLASFEAMERKLSAEITDLESMVGRIRSLRKKKGTARK